MGEWLRSGEYLPAPLRDFHDQKDVFKAIHQLVKVNDNKYIKDVDWITGHCYVIDIFLWWMAKRGYTLQRSRKQVPFRSLADDVAECRRVRDEAHFSALKSAFEAKEQA